MMTILVTKSTTPRTVIVITMVAVDTVIVHAPDLTHHVSNGWFIFFFAVRLEKNALSIDNFCEKFAQMRMGVPTMNYDC